jgi:hypothetical protein
MTPVIPRSESRKADGYVNAGTAREAVKKVFNKRWGLHRSATLFFRMSRNPVLPWCRSASL